MPVSETEKYTRQCPGISGDRATASIITRPDGVNLQALPARLTLPSNALCCVKGRPLVDMLFVFVRHTPEVMMVKYEKSVSLIRRIQVKGKCDVNSRSDDRLSPVDVALCP